MLAANLKSRSAHVRAPLCFPAGTHRAAPRKSSAIAILNGFPMREAVASASRIADIARSRTSAMPQQMSQIRPAEHAHVRPREHRQEPHVTLIVHRHCAIHVPMGQLRARQDGTKCCPAVKSPAVAAGGFRSADPNPVNCCPNRATFRDRPARCGTPRSRSGQQESASSRQALPTIRSPDGTSLRLPVSRNPGSPRAPDRDSRGDPIRAHRVWRTPGASHTGQARDVTSWRLHCQQNAAAPRRPHGDNSRSPRSAFPASS